MKRSRMSSVTSQTTNGDLEQTQLKYSAISEENSESATTEAITCSLPPHLPEVFTDSTSYERHYLAQHTYRCIECQRNLPSSHLLELHISECHDPIVAATMGRGEKTYGCFVEGCDKLCMDWQKRRSHLVDKHHFPRNYDFLVVQNGIDGRRSLLRPGIDQNGRNITSETTLESYKPRRATSRWTGVGTDHPMPADSSQSPPPDPIVDAIADKLSTLQMVPRSVTFGQRKGRSGFAKQ